MSRVDCGSSVAGRRYTIRVSLIGIDLSVTLRLLKGNTNACYGMKVINGSEISGHGNGKLPPNDGR